MQTKATIEPAGSPVPGVIPDPVRVQYEAADPPPAPRRGPLSHAWARWLSALHGDKYMVPTDPPTWGPPPAGRSGARGDAS
jgi:hypothetical protein